MISNTINKKVHLIIFMMFLTFGVFSQTGKLIKADKNFNNFNFQNAIEHYLDLAKSGYKTTNKGYVSTRLGDAYRLINDPKNAELWYRIAIESDNCETKTYYDFAQVLRSNKKYDEAAVWIKKYLEKNPNDKAAVKELAEFKNYTELMADSNRITIREMKNINTSMADFSPSYYNEKIIFVSSRDTISARRSSWTDQPFYTLYECTIDSNLQLVSYKKLFGEVNTKYHEGPVSYDKNSNELYFTRSNYINGKKGKSKDNTNYLKIYKAGFKEGKWAEIKELPFNNNEYSCAHPAISPDGSRLYFISNMPGGYGGTDIYYCDKVGDGWSAPKNMGETVNTAGNELFPSFSNNNVFYFASTGHPGLGGLDIYSFQDGKVTNLGYPINTSFDDFGITTLNDDKGYFSSNRSYGLNNDDIFFFKINQPPVAKIDKLFIEIIGENYPKDTVLIEILKNDNDLNNDIDTSRTSIIKKTNNKSFTNLNKNGILNYCPQKGFRGIDTLEYVVYDKTNLSDTSLVLIYVFGKNPPVATADELIVHKNSKNNEINVLLNDYDVDSNLVTTRIEIVQESQNGGTIEVDKGFVSYTPARDYVGKDTIVYRIWDETGLTDIDTLFIDVKMMFMGKEVTENMELNLIIHFKSGKWDITPQAAVILDSVVAVLKENLNIEIELGAHTDCNGSSKSNQILSQKRAESAVGYIINQGIDKGRLTAIGYGESQPVNHCVDGVKCSKEDLAKNRRVTIRLTKY